jgi:hypothetical protein
VQRRKKRRSPGTRKRQGSLRLKSRAFAIGMKLDNGSEALSHRGRSQRPKSGLRRMNSRAMRRLTLRRFKPSMIMFRQSFVISAFRWVSGVINRMRPKMC